MKKEDFIYILLIFLFVMILNLNWIMATIKGDGLGIEEGYMDLAGSSSLSESRNLFYYDSIVYGQPTEGIPYGRLSILIIPILLNFIMQNSVASFAATFISIFFFTSLVLFMLLSEELKLRKDISLFFSLIYILSHPLLTSTLAHGHLRFLMIISFPILLAYIWIKIFNSSHYQVKILILLFIIISAAIINAQIISFFLFFVLLMCVTPLIIRVDKKYYFKIAFILSILIIPIVLVWIIYYKLYFNSIFYFEGFNSQNYIYNEMSRPLLILFENIGIPNRIPVEIQASTSVFYNLIFSLPFFLFLTFFIVKGFDRYNGFLLILIISIMFLASGTYGPFSIIYNEYSLPFRAPGRTFLPISFPFLIILGAVGCNTISTRIKDDRIKILSVIGLSILSMHAYSIGLNYQYIYNIDSGLDNAYSNIEPYNRVMTVPIWGNIGSSTSLSYNGTYDYQQYPTVGYSLSHINYYLVVKHHLKDVFSPMSGFESPFLTTWVMSDFLWEKIIKWNDYDGFYQHTKLFPNLRYIIIYKHILPQNIVDGLSKNQKVKTIYENEKISVLEIKNQTSNEIITSNNGFLLYTSSWHYGHSTILTLLEKYNISYPIIFEATTPWYMLGPNKFDKNMTLVFNNIYSIKDLALDNYLFNSFNKGDIIFKYDSLDLSRFWQPSYNKMYTFIQENDYISRKINIENTGEYRILIRIVYNGIWRGSYSVSLDGKKIINYDIKKDHFGWEWINSSKLFLEKGYHELKIDNIVEYGDINSIIIIPEDEYKNIMLKGYELNKDISQKRCISGYEFEHITGFENISEENAVSGGHVRPYIVKGIVDTDIFSPCRNIKYAIVLGNVTELKINNVSLNPINLNNGLLLYKPPEILNGDNIFLYAKGESLDAIWLTNFDPIKLYNIKTNIVDTPKSYWVEDTFQYSPDQKFILLLKSYSPMFDIKYKDNEYRPYVANMMFNGFYIKDPKKFDNNSDDVSIELSYLNALKDI